jgi:hypothetical protein
VAFLSFRGSSFRRLAAILGLLARAGLWRWRGRSPLPFRPREPVSLPTIKGLNRPRTLIEVRVLASTDGRGGLARRRRRRCPLRRRRRAALQLGLRLGGSLNGDEGDVLALVLRLVVRDLSGAHVSPRCSRQRRGTPRSSREASTQSPTDLDFDASGGASQSSSSATSSTTSSSFSSIRSSRRCLAIRP